MFKYDAREIFAGGSGYLRPEDLRGRSVTVTIRTWRQPSKQRKALYPGTRLIVELDRPVNGKRIWYVTPANGHRLREFLGPDLQTWYWSSVTLAPARSRNLKTGGTQPVIRVQSACHPIEEEEWMEEEDEGEEDDEYADNGAVYIAAPLFEDPQAYARSKTRRRKRRRGRRR